MQSQEQFFVLLGQTSTVWAQVESSLCVLFARITRMDSTLARRIFFSAKSFSGRLEMLKEAACCPTINFDPTEHGQLVKDFIKIAKTYSEVRNVIAHDSILFFGFEGHEHSGQYVMVDGKYDRFIGGENALSSQQLTSFHQNISHYLMILRIFLQCGSSDKKEDFEQCLSLLQKLPKRPRDIGLTQSEVALLVSRAPTKIGL